MTGTTRHRVHEHILLLPNGMTAPPVSEPEKSIYGNPRHGEHMHGAGCRQIAAGLVLPHLNLAGETGLLQAAALLEQAQLFVGSDSGLGHLAAASGTPTVTLFGPGDPRRYHTRHPQARWVQGEDSRINGVGVGQVVEQVQLSLMNPRRACKSF